MIITTDDYILKQLEDCSIFWDLTFPKVINKGKENERVEFKDPLYGVTLDTAKKKIALWRVNKINSDLTPKEFKTLYKKEKNLIEEELGSL